MIQEIEKLNDEYLKWLKDKTILKQIKDCVEITTPYLDRHNDYLQIYVKRENNEYILTDDGYTIEDLEMSGCLLDSVKRQNLLKATLQGFGVQKIDKALTVKATATNFGPKKHDLIQAILAVNDLFYLAKSHVSNFFAEDVAAWLDLGNIRYSSKIRFPGKMGYDHFFDFLIPKSVKAPERILKVINHPTKDSAEAAVFAWIDTKDTRPPDSQAYVILNDTESKMSSKIIDACERYDLHPIPWSQKGSFQERLAA